MVYSGREEATRHPAAGREARTADCATKHNRGTTGSDCCTGSLRAKGQRLKLTFV